MTIDGEDDYFTMPSYSDCVLVPEATHDPEYFRAFTSNAVQAINDIREETGYGMDKKDPERVKERSSSTIITSF